MRNSKTWLLALGALTVGGVAAAMPPDPPDVPSEPNLPPPAQPASPPTSPPTSPMTPVSPTPPSTPAPQIPAVPSTPDTPQTPQGPTPASPTPIVPATPADDQPRSAPPDVNGAPASPQSVEVVPYPYGYSARPYNLYRPRLASDIGVAVTVGGGLSGFTDKTMRESMTSNVGGMWDARATFGTHIPLGIELGYVGTAGNLQSLAGTPNGTLVGTAVEGALRWTILPHRAWTPYLFAGMGWQHYATYSTTLQTADSGLKSTDDVAEFPLGAGFSFRDVGGFTFDLRGTYRAETASTLLEDPRTHSYAGMDNWEASASLGYEF